MPVLWGCWSLGQFGKGCWEEEKKECIPDAANETFVLQEVKGEMYENFPETLVALTLQQDARRHLSSCLIVA